MAAPVGSLRVHTSNVPDGGLGLFTATKIVADSEITRYEGTILPTAEAIKRTRDKSYLMRLGPQVGGHELACGTTQALL